jgi:hypothetical protein
MLCVLRPKKVSNSTGEIFMVKLNVLASTLICGAFSWFASPLHAQGNEFATGNMHFNAKEMDTNGDHMITHEEMIAYAGKTWEMMAHGKDTIPVGIADKDFASGGVNYRARTIDEDHDGTISKEEYVAYATRKFESMKKTDNMVSVDDMAKAIARGNEYPKKE